MPGIFSGTHTYRPHFFPIPGRAQGAAAEPQAPQNDLRAAARPQPAAPRWHGSSGALGRSLARSLREDAARLRATRPPENSCAQQAPGSSAVLRGLATRSFHPAQQAHQLTRAISTRLEKGSARAKTENEKAGGTFYLDFDSFKTEFLEKNDIHTLHGRLALARLVGRDPALNQYLRSLPREILTQLVAYLRGDGVSGAKRGRTQAFFWLFTPSVINLALNSVAALFKHVAGNSIPEEWEVARMLLIGYMRKNEPELTRRINELAPSRKKEEAALLMNRFREVESQLWRETRGEQFATILDLAHKLFERLNFLLASLPPGRIDWNERIPKTEASSRKGLELYGLTRREGFKKLRSLWPNSQLKDIEAELEDWCKLPESRKNVSRRFRVNLSYSEKGGTGKTTLPELLAAVLGWNVVKLSDLSLNVSLLKGRRNYELHRNLNDDFASGVGLLPYLARKRTPTVLILDNVKPESLLTSTPGFILPRKRPAEMLSAGKPGAATYSVSQLPPPPPPGFAASGARQVRGGFSRPRRADSQSEESRQSSESYESTKTSSRKKTPQGRVLRYLPNLDQAHGLQSVFDPDRYCYCEPLQEEVEGNNVLVFITTNVGFADMPEEIRNHVLVEPLRHRLREQMYWFDEDKARDIILHGSNLEGRGLSPKVEKAARLFLGYILKCSAVPDGDGFRFSGGVRGGQNAFNFLLNEFQEFERKRQVSKDDLLKLASTIRERLGTPPSLDVPVPDIDPAIFDVDVIDLEDAGSVESRDVPMLIDLDKEEIPLEEAGENTRLLASLFMPGDDASA